MTSILTILFDGIAYGMLLFVLACGLAVTLGLMNFVNLAHGAFATAQGGLLIRSKTSVQRRTIGFQGRSPRWTAWKLCMTNPFDGLTALVVEDIAEFFRQQDGGCLRPPSEPARCR